MVSPPKPKTASSKSEKTNEPSISQIIDYLNQKAPPTTAESWDNVGFLAGDPSWKTKGAILSIDLTLEAVQEAVQRGFRLIITHHPAIFPKERGLTRLLAGSALFEAVHQGIGVAAYHTNFDKCALEVMEKVSLGLGFKIKGRLADKTSGALMKIVTYVPESHLDAVRAALCEAGAGHIGNYDFCTFQTLGEGTFRGDSSSQPFLGKPGMLEKASEFRLETIFPHGMKERILTALKAAHPYEEVAYDFYKVEQPYSMNGVAGGLGYGLWGEFPSPKAFSDVAKDVKSLFDIHGFWLTDPAPLSVSRVGFVAGKGASFVDSAVAVGCDLFITGEAGYHLALGASQKGMAVMEVGHRESETFFAPTVKKWLSAFDLETVESQTPTQKIWSGGI